MCSVAWSESTLCLQSSSPFDVIGTVVNTNSLYRLPEVCQDAFVTESRTYTSPLRASQAEQTHNLILDTLAEMVAEDGFEGIVVNELAKRAGLAARTVYRHFPDRDALHDALAKRISDLAVWTATGLSEKSSDWPEVIQQVFLEFDAQETVSTVAARLNAVRGRASSDSNQRRSSFRDQIRAEFPTLAEAEIEALLAVVQLLGSSRTWLRLREELNMTGEQSGPIMRWLLELVLADVEKRGGLPTFETGEV